MAKVKRDSGIFLDRSDTIVIKDINNNLEDTSIIDISQSTTRLLWTNNVVKYSVGANNSITINLCNDLDIEIVLDKGVTQINTISLYCDILRMWYPCNLCNYGKASMQLILNTIDKVSQCKSILKARDYATQLAVTIRKLNTCKSVCKTVTPNKSTGVCMFKLSDVQTINKFTAEGIVDVLNSLAYELANRDNKKLYVDLEDVVVTCDGSMYIIKFTEFKDKPIDLLKKCYDDYIYNWYRANSTKISDCYKLCASVDAVMEATTIQEIFLITGSLLDTL